MRRALPSKIASSMATLPVAVCLYVVLWALLSCDPLVLGLTAIATYILMEMNNRNTLIRIRTRMSSSIFVVGLPLLCAACPHTALVCAILSAAALSCLFATYDHPSPTLHVFHCFVCLGVATLLCPPLAVLVPLFWLHLIIYMRAWNLRILSASVLGIALVAVAAGIAWTVGYSQWVPDIGQYLPHTGAWALPSAPCAATLCFGLVAAAAYVQQSYDDKIQVRMMNYVLIVTWGAAQLLVLVLPQHANTLMPTVWMLSAPLIAHQWAVARTWRMTAWMIITIIGLSLTCFSI